LTENRRFFALWEQDDERVTIDGDEFHHVRTVMRTRVGDWIEVINGQGGWARAKIERMTRNKLEARLDEKQFAPKPPLRTVIAVSVLRGPTMSWMVEKLCEIGVDTVIPMTFQRTELHSKNNHPALERWRKLAAQALKVNRRLWLSEIHEPLSLTELLTVALDYPHRLLLDCEGPRDGQWQPSFPVLATIGPPGDFTAEEKTALRSQGFQPLLINDSLLKTETAAISIAAILHHD